MIRIVWLPESLDDLQRVHEFIAEHNAAAAAKATAPKGKEAEEKTSKEKSRSNESELQKILRMRELKSFREEGKDGR